MQDGGEREKVQWENLSVSVRESGQRKWVENERWVKGLTLTLVNEIPIIDSESGQNKCQLTLQYRLNLARCVCLVWELMDTVEVEGMLHIWSYSYCVLQQTMFPMWHTNKQFFSFVRQESHSTTLVACIILGFEPWVTNRNGHRNSKQRENSSNGNKLHGHIAIIAKLSPHYVLTKFTISSL